MIDWYKVGELKPKNQQQFIANFGVIPQICSFLFSILINKYNKIKWKPAHVLMALYFLKVYPLEEQAALVWRITR